MQIVMIGAGYVGLVSGACFADFGHDVTCVDHIPEKIEALKSGKIPIFEPGLEDIVASNAKSGRLKFSTNVAEAVKSANVVFIAVGTPSRRGDGHADLSYVYDAAREIAKCIENYTVIVIKSTAPVGTGDEVARIIAETSPSAEFSVVSNPEFLREGAAINDFKHPDRIVIGVDSNDNRAREVMNQVYRPLYLNQAPILYTTRRTSELIKYAANGFLAMKITFINEIADLCEKVGADVQQVARGIGLDNRIGGKFLNAGPGYGGSCFPKDTLALAKTGQDYEAPLKLIEATIAVNDLRKRAMARKVIRALHGSVRGKTIAILGLTFKPSTDDMRDAPSLDIIQALQDAGANIRAYDPEGMPTARSLLKDIEFGENPYDICQGADALVFVTEWEQFRALDLKRIKSSLRTPVIVDLRNIYNPSSFSGTGLRYSGIGRPSSDTLES